MDISRKELLGCVIAAVVIYGTIGYCSSTPTHPSIQEAPKAYRYPDPPDNPSPNAPFRQGEPRPLPREEIPTSSGNELEPLNRPNMTMDGEEGINPWDIEPTEYDLMYEDPDLYDFIAD